MPKIENPQEKRVVAEVTPLSWTTEETARLTDRAQNIAVLREKIIAKISTPAEEMRFKELVAEVQQMIDQKERGSEQSQFPEIIARVKEKNVAFFGQEFVVPQLPAEVTPEKVAFWEKNGFQLHWFPKLDMADMTGATPDWKSFSGWTKKPNKPPTEITSTLPGGWILFDVRVKPQYDNGAQMYSNDECIGKALETLRDRTAPVIDSYDSVHNPRSRFGIKGSVLDGDKFKKVIGRALQIPFAHVDVPYQIETSVLMHMYRPEWGNTTTYEWFKDKDTSGQRRLCGGYSARGGLSYVSWGALDGRHSDIGWRPLGRFS